MEIPKRECDVGNANGGLAVSIVVDNYNYARFLPEAIESALRQDYAPTEVIVVDDGSTDGSRDVIASYGHRVQAVLKENGGQASAFNAGFSAARGDVVLFLDADDVLFPHAVTEAVARFESDVSKVHWPLQVVDAEGQPNGRTHPGHPLPEGDLRDIVLERGPSNCPSSPTSGNAWARWFLEQVLPIPENVAYYRTCADEYLYTLAPVFGRIRASREPLGRYRIHAGSIYSGRTFRDKLRIELEGYDQQCAALSAALRRGGIEVDAARWRAHSWFHRLKAGLDELARLVPDGEVFILVDDDTWGREQIFEFGRARPFLEREGTYWGPPADDDVAVRELERMRIEGARFLVLAWPAFWWRDHYPRFFECLRSRHGRVHGDQQLEVYDLSPPPAAAQGG
jgi:glycosyltransferase involved in cell wall biosynthesis